MPNRSNEESLRDALRTSKLIQGLPVEPQRCVLEEEDLDAIASAVVTKVREVMFVELGRLAWDAARKLVISGAFTLIAIDQIKGWIK